MSNFQAFILGRKPKTKKQLREALAATPGDVTFDDTSAIDNRGTLTADQLSPMDVIVGPDVYTDRRWYANVVNGRVK